MVVVPTSLLLLPLFSLFGLMDARTVNGQLAYEIARFAALADADSEEQREYLQRLSPNAKLEIATTTGCSAVVSLSRRIQIFAWPEEILLTSIGKAQCETP